MTNSPVKYKFLFSVSDMNKCPASFFTTACILSLVQTSWAAEEMLSTVVLRYPQSDSGTATGFSPSLGKFSTECLTKGIGSCCLFPSWVFKTDVNVCMFQILRNGMCSLKTIHAEELPVHKGSYPAPTMRNIQKLRNVGGNPKCLVLT